MSMLASLARRYGDRLWFSRLGRTYVPLDRLLGRLSRGRLVGLGLDDLPSLLLTTTGRRSGQARTNPLLYVRDGDDFVVVGSNWGQPHHPAWSANLLASPDATVTVHGQRIAVHARLVGGAERQRLWEKLLAIWPAYAAYEQRASDRHIRIFKLEPGSRDSAPPGVDQVDQVG